MFEKKCSHAWDVRAKTESPRVTAIQVHNQLVGDELIRECWQGVTRFLLTCSKCGAIEVRRVCGIETATKDEDSKP
jgi:hypothetical protein